MSDRTSSNRFMSKRLLEVSCTTINRTILFLNQWIYRGPAPFHRLTPNKRFEPVFSTVIMSVYSLFNRMLLLTDLIPVHLVYCGQTVMIGCNHTSFEWTRAVRHIYRIIRHMQGLYRPIQILAAHNWQKWKSTFLTCHCHKIFRVEAVGLKKVKLYF